MGLRYPDQINSSCFFVTTTFKRHAPLGDIRGVYETLAESLVFYAKKYEAKIASYVFMPSHLHLLIFIDGNLLSTFMRDFKKYISQKAIKDIGVSTDGIWMPRYDRVAVRTEEVFRIKLDYIHENPVKAGLASEDRQWKWSSAGDYMSDVKSFIPVWKDWG